MKRRKGEREKRSSRQFSFSPPSPFLLFACHLNPPFLHPSHLHRVAFLFDPAPGLESPNPSSILLPMKTTTMTLTKKRQTVFPLDWCRSNGLEKGGPLNVFDLGGGHLLVRAVKPPTQAEADALLAGRRPGKESPKEAMKIVERALRKVRGA